MVNVRVTLLKQKPIINDIAVIQKFNDNINDFKQSQRDVLKQQAEIARRFDLPLNVHSRSAGKPTILHLKVWFGDHHLGPGFQAWLAGPQPWLAGAHALLDGPWGGMDVRMHGRTDGQTVRKSRNTKKNAFKE